MPKVNQKIHILLQKKKSGNKAHIPTQKVT